MEATDWISNRHFYLWYGLLKVNDGRFTAEPIFQGGRVYVSYSFDDMDDCNKFLVDFRRFTTPITETKRGFWKRIKNKMGI
jgi:hypothetical protein